MRRCARRTRVAALLAAAVAVCVGPIGKADGQGRAWFALDEAGKYEGRVEGREKTMVLDVRNVPFRLEAGFGYLPRITLEVER